jgi:hypothetical protein
MTGHGQGDGHAIFDGEPREARIPDKHYYRARAEAERSMAGQADSPKVAAIHAELAEQYEALLAAGDRHGGLRLVVSN